jgi:hypothetical protein
MTEPSEVRLVPLATMTLTLRAPLVFEPTPGGSRWVVEAEAGQIEGARIRAEITGHANADWFVVGPGQIGTVDARLLAKTDDGAFVLLQYNGRVDVSAGPGPIYIAPRFDTGDERYRWLNLVQAVGRGAFVDLSTLVYDLYEVQ